jgi:hypothetical protein
MTITRVRPASSAGDAVRPPHSFYRLKSQLPVVENVLFEGIHATRYAQ